MRVWVFTVSLIASVLVVSAPAETVQASYLCPGGAPAGSTVVVNGKTFTCFQDQGWLRAIVAPGRTSLITPIVPGALSAPQCELFEVGCLEGLRSPRYSRGAYRQPDPADCDLRRNVSNCPPRGPHVDRVMSSCERGESAGRNYVYLSANQWHYCHNLLGTAVRFEPRYHPGDHLWYYFAPPQTAGGYYGAVPEIHTNWYRTLNDQSSSLGFEQSCVLVHNCHGGHGDFYSEADSDWYRNYFQHRSEWDYWRVDFERCDRRCSAWPQLRLPSVILDPPAEEPCPPGASWPSSSSCQPPTPTQGGQVIVSLNVPTAYTAQGKFLTQGADVSSVTLTCGQGSPCTGMYAPSIVAVYGTLRMVGVNGFNSFTVTTPDISPRLRAGDQIRAAFYSPTSSFYSPNSAPQYVRVQVDGLSAQIQIWEPEAYFDEDDNLVWHMVSRVVPASVTVTPSNALAIRNVFGSVGGGTWPRL